MRCYSYDEWPRIAGMLENGWYLIALSRKSYVQDNHRFVTYPKGERLFYLHKSNGQCTYRTLALDDMEKATDKRPRPRRDFRDIVCIGFKKQSELQYFFLKKFVIKKA